MTDREPLSARRSIVLVCACGTMWRQADIDEYNQGSIEVAAGRHLDFWKLSRILHRLYTPADGKEIVHASS